MKYQLSPAYVHALTAAVGAPERAVAAYTAWRSDGHAPDDEERRLLASIAANVALLLPDDEWLTEIHAKRRLTLVTNVRRAASCKQVADALRAGGIDSLWFKGVGLLTWYRDPSLRSMADADLLVPWHLRHDAIDLLAARGFAPVGAREVDAMHALTDSFPGWGMHAGEVEVDVHWRPLHYLANRPHVDAQVFARARAATLASVSLVVPDPSDHFALVLAHGMRAASEAHLISLVDACQLLHAPDFDAERAAQLARDYERTTALLEACELFEQLRLPPELEAQIAAVRGSLHRRTIADRMVGYLSNAPDAPFGPNEHKRKLQNETWRALSATPLRVGGPVGGLLDVGRREMGVRRVRDMPGELLWRAAGRRAALERFRADRGTPPQRRRRLAVGDRVQVGETDVLTSLLPTGWWNPESHHVWSDGPEAVIDFDIDLGAATSCTIALEVWPFVSRVSPVLAVAVSVNCRPYSTWKYTLGSVTEQMQRLLITKSALDGGRCQIMFVFRGTSSPLAAGQSDDARQLGLCFRSLTIEPVSNGG